MLASTPLEREKTSGATNEMSALASKIDAPKELVLTPRAIPQDPALGPVVTARAEAYHRPQDESDWGKVTDPQRLAPTSHFVLANL